MKRAANSNRFTVFRIGNFAAYLGNLAKMSTIVRGTVEISLHPRKYTA